MQVHDEQGAPSVYGHGGDDAYAGKKTYFVSVLAGPAADDPAAASYELEISANEEELDRLQRLFEEMPAADEAQALGASTLLDIYKLLYRLGTTETKEHIASMGLLPAESLP